MPYLHIQPESHKHVALFSDVLDDIREHFSVQDAGAAFSGNRFASNRYYPITPTGLCPIGFVYHVLQHALKTFQAIDVQISPDALKMIAPVLTKSPSIITPNTIDKLRDYQIKAIEASLIKGRGIIEHPTSAGKTPLMASLILSCLQLTKGQIVVLVPDPGLMSQTYQSFIKFGIDDIYKWDKETESEQNLRSHRVIIAHQKLLVRRKDAVKQYLSKASVLIVDECHSLQKGNNINRVIDCFKTPNRYGLTGTLPDTIQSQWNVIGKLGPVIARETAIDLSEKGYIAGVEAVRLCIHYASKPPIVDEGELALRPALGIQVESAWLIEQQFRMDVITKVAGNLPKNVLILVDRIATGENLVRLLNEKYPNKTVVFVNGSVEVKVREQIKQLIEANEDIIAIAMMQIFRQGIDISNLHYLVLASAGKAKGRMIQAIGRGRRLHPNKIKLFLFDIVDVVGYGIRHGYDRLAILQDQQINTTDKHFYEQRHSATSN